MKNQHLLVTVLFPKNKPSMINSFHLNKLSHEFNIKCFFPFNFYPISKLFQALRTKLFHSGTLIIREFYWSSGCFFSFQDSENKTQITFEVKSYSCDKYNSSDDIRHFFFSFINFFFFYIFFI